jgi:hypothetical protein
MLAFCDVVMSHLDIIVQMVLSGVVAVISPHFLPLLPRPMRSIL